MLKIGVVGDKKWLNTSLYSFNSSIAICELTKTNHFHDFVLIQDAIIISKTTQALAIAEWAIKYEKPIFIEHLPSFSLADLEVIIKLSKESNHLIDVYFQNKNQISFLEIATKITQPLFIETHRLCTFNSSKIHQDVVEELMLHDLAMVLTLVKSELKRISVTGVKVVGAYNDIANARLEFSNGCIANFTASQISLKEMSKMRIFQNDSYYTLDFLTQKTDFVSLSKQEFIEPTLQVNTQISTQINSLQAYIEHFTHCIFENKKPIASIEDAFQTLSIIHKILKKINSFNEE